ncbi:MAG TPA: multicopper oxidase family protein [Candidatus Acidoferrales bacterium]|nr:multicopper oxidase family protein [Candidatus Acidoferrales bacterium]
MISRAIKVCSLAFALQLAACVGSGGSWPAPPAPSTSDLANPPEVDSVNGTLNVTFTAAVNPATGGPGIEYNGAFVPPTLRVNPGDTIDITYTNDLPASNALPYNDASLHFHGFSTSPNPPADDSIGMLAMPGQTLHYSVPVPLTQPPGLYWYHSHSMGESNWQLYNGMSGAIVVNGIASFAPETAGLPERIIVLRNVIANEPYSDTTSESHRALERRADGTLVDTTCSQPWDVGGEYSTINGQTVGTQRIVVPSGQKQFWRVLNASADGFYNVSIDGAGLQMVAIDGVPLKNTYPGASEQTVGNIVIPPSSRAEFIVTGTGGTVAFRTSCTDTGPVGDPNPPQVLAQVYGSGQTASLPLVATPGPTPPAHGTYEEAMGSPVRQRTVIFSENANSTAFYINGTQWAAASGPMFTVASGTVEQWTLENTTGEVHVFHTHQVHFIVQDINGVAQPPYWRDTVTLPYTTSDTPSITHVLIDFRDPEVKGTFLFHCHLQQHADLGMMASVLVQ